MYKGQLPLNLSDLVEQMQRKYRDVPPELVRAAVRRMFAEIIDTLADGGRVELRGFGSFDVRERAGGDRRNPKTGEPIVVEDKRTVYWRTSTVLASALKDTGS